MAPTRNTGKISKLLGKPQSRTKGPNPPQANLETDSPVRRSARLRGNPPVAPPLVVSTSQQVPAALSPDEPSASPDREYGGPEEGPGPERHQIGPQSIGGRTLPLTMRNLRAHTLAIDPQAGPSVAERAEQAERAERAEEAGRSGAITKTTTPQESEDSRTSSIRTPPGRMSDTTYRYNGLNMAGIYVNGIRTPPAIRARIDAIIQSGVGPEERAEISKSGKKFGSSYAALPGSAATERKWIRPLSLLLEALDRSEMLSFEPDIVWDSRLKPVIRRRTWNLEALLPNPVGGDEDPSERQPGDASPGAMRGKTANRLPISQPPPRRNGLPSHLKTPRPDISVGFRRAALIDELERQGLATPDAESFLDILQDHATSRNEPALLFTPAEAFDLHFPFLQLEAKSYMSLSPIFAAQNQAAVSGACALNILHALDALAGGNESETGSKYVPLVFSICTKGPTLQLWAHYTAAERGARTYNMVIVRSCNALLRGDLSKFVVAVHSVLSWGTGPFLEEIATKLAKMAEKAGVDA